jgi:hypothetical protein
MMTLEQMNQAWAERSALPAKGPNDDIEEELTGVDLEEIFDEDDDDDDDAQTGDTEADLNNACDLLHQAMDMLCSMSDRRKDINRKEKREMIEMAEEIFQFLDEIGDITEEDR